MTLFFGVILFVFYNIRMLHVNYMYLIPHKGVLLWGVDVSLYVSLVMRIRCLMFHWARLSAFWPSSDLVTHNNSHYFYYQPHKSRYHCSWHVSCGRVSRCTSFDFSNLGGCSTILVDVPITLMAVPISLVAVPSIAALSSTVTQCKAFILMGLTCSVLALFEGI